MGLSLQLLGVPKVATAGNLSDLPLDKPASLLFYLAHRGDWVSRSELAFLYRPDAPENVALSNVRVYLHRAKERLWAQSLEVEKLRVRYPVETDVQAFEKALERQAWASALQLYRGPFLSGIHVQDAPGYETWLELERQDLAQKWRAAALHHSRSLEEQQDFAAAESWLEPILRADPLDEEALGAYLRALFAAGKRKQAVAAYEAFKQLLKRELDVEPLETTQALFESLSASEAGVKRMAVPKVKHNLPAQTTRFVGRQRELAKLASLLEQPDCRLLTLVGLGGVGKTRLGLELAARQLETYQDGVWFVPLAGVASPDLLASTIAGALQFSFSGSSGPKDQLNNFLREKELLLLLDNFEHLVEGAVLLEELLEAAPRLRLLVTSRIALELSAEWLLDLEGLAYPPVVTEEPLESFDAVKLFINRAERLSATFVPQGDTLQAVAELTRKVEGLPLALELAASWTRSLSVPQLLGELDKNLDVLSGQLRDLPERHRNLRTVFDYSWGRLAEKEQQALAKLSVFQGGFTLEAAEQVTGIHLALLLNLINHVLLRQVEGRYQLHELVRQYVLEKLKPPLRSQLEGRFAHYYLGLVAGQEEALHNRRQLVMRQLLNDADNIRLAWSLAVRQRRWGELDRALQGIFQLWLRANLFKEGESLMIQPLENAATDDPISERLRARARLRLGYFQRNLGSFEEAKQNLQEASATLRRLDLKTELTFSLHELGHVARKTGDLAQAEVHARASLELSRVVNDDALSADVLFHLSLLRRDQGRFAEAKAHLEECIALAMRSAHFAHAATFRAQLGVLILQSGGDSAEAKRYLEQGLETFRQLEDKDEISIVLLNLGRLAYEQGDFEQSRLLLLECLKIRRDIGSPYVQESVLSTLGEIARDQERYLEARTFFEQSFELSQRLNSPMGQVYALVDLGDIARRLKDMATARSYFKQALVLTNSASIPTGVTLEVLYFVILFTQTYAPTEAYLCASHLSLQEGMTRHLKERIIRLTGQLEAKLPSQVVEGLRVEVASLSRETLLATQLALLEGRS